MPLTMGEFLTAQRLRKESKNWAQIAREIGLTVERVRGALDRQWAERRSSIAHGSRSRRLQEIKEARSCPTLPKLKNQEPGKQLIIPREVLADRDARMALAPASITAALMGDPVFGRSALDRRVNAGSNR